MTDNTSNKIIDNFIDNILRTKEEYQNTPIPELCNISLKSFQRNNYYDEFGFRGISGVQVITPSQTIMFGVPLMKYIKHIDLFNTVYSKIFSGNKLKKVTNQLSQNILSFDDKINRISIRYVNSINYNGEIDADNFCVIYGDIDNINSYQKDILIKIIEAITKKDPNTLIYDYKNGKRITIEDAKEITPNDNQIIDKEEKIISNDQTDYVSDISNYSNKNTIEYFYTYEPSLKEIIPIQKIDGIDNEILTNHGYNVLEPATLNKMIINKMKIGYPSVFTDIEKTFPEILK